MVDQNIDSNTPDCLSAAISSNEGEINLQWEPVKDAKFYIIQAQNGNRAWKEIDIVSSTTYTASQLKSGKHYRFRVAAVSSRGQGGWSIDVSKRSP